MLHSEIARLQAAVMLALALTGCHDSDVGVPCTPEEEYQEDFSGFAVEEVNFESRSFQCESRTCLVNHFQGRVSCPYGQSQAQAAGDASCRLPGDQGPVRAAVAPQLLARRAEDAVYCSCRCDGPDTNARYCECPNGFACVKLVPDFATRAELAGSYCVREGTEYQTARAAQGPVCDPASASCG